MEIHTGPVSYIRHVHLVVRSFHLPLMPLAPRRTIHLKNDPQTTPPNPSISFKVIGPARRKPFSHLVLPRKSALPNARGNLE
jgi:hypothetical protein